VSELKRSGIIADARPGGLRISPYFYNNDADILNFVESMVKLREISPEYFSVV
jgi:selenocysteine lyase/cysteine desulfurase